MWNTICIEGYCFGEKDYKYPCGRKNLSTFCFGDSDIGMCPHFAYADSDEREASYFVPLILILWDRLQSVVYVVFEQLKWWFWGKWTYDDSWIDNIPVIECPEIYEMEDKIAKEFPVWLEKANKNERI